MLMDNAVVKPQIAADGGIVFGEMADRVVAQDVGHFHKAFRMVEYPASIER